MHRIIAGVFSSLLIGFLSVSQFADASTIDKVRGTQAIVSFDGEETPAAGDKFFAMENGKKKAVLEIVQFKNGKAKVKILKGKAREGMTLTTAGSHGSGKGKAHASEDADAAESAPKGRHKATRNAGAATIFKDMTIGGSLGYAMDSQTVTPSGSSAQAMSGTGFSFKGFADIPVSGPLALLTRAGVEQFNVQTGTFKSEIMYAAVDLLLKYAFSEGGFAPFVMGGLGLYFPISKTSNILDVNRVSSTTVFYGGGGVNWVMSGSMYFQVTGEYGMFPPSNDVSTSFIAARAGLGFRF